MQRKPLTDKLIVLGVDGMDPSLTKKFLDEGVLPNIQEYIDRGACRDDLVMLGQQPTITPPMWTTLATGARAGTHGITCFWNQDHENLDTMVFNLDSRKCKAEQVWNILAEEGKKTLVFHWPGSSWPPSSDSPNLSVVDGITPGSIGTGNSIVDWEKIVVADKDFDKVTYVPRKTVDNGAGCIITDVEVEDVDPNGVGMAVMSELDENGEKKVTNIELEETDGELGLDASPIDVVNSPIKDANGWANAPEGAKEFYILLADGLMRRPCLILKNEQGVYDRIAMYKSKKAEEPLLVLGVNDRMTMFTEKLPYKEGETTCARGYRIVDLAEDGSHLRLSILVALDMENDVLWHPKSLHKDILENVGPWEQTAVYGTFDPVIARKTLLESWDNYCDWQSRALNYCAEEAGYEIIFSHIHNVDNLGHKLWMHAKPEGDSKEDIERAEAYQDLIRDIYIQTDRYLGSFLHLLDEGWTVIITSDHGLLVMPDLHPPLIGDAFGCNVRVMEELGFTVLKRDSRGQVIKEIDWDHTKAVATRGNHIWINLKGRDTHGIVDPADKWQVEEEIIDALYNYRFKGKRVIQLALRNKDAKLLGMYGPECGDIMYWLTEDFNRLHGDTISTSTGFFDTSVSPIFIAAGKGVKEGFKTERIIDELDVAPTVAALTGVRMPAQCEGAPVYQILTEEF